MSLKPQLEAIIYAAETPISLDQIIPLVKDSILAETPEIEATEIRSRVRAMVEELLGDYAGPSHGIEIRQVAGGYRMSTKPEQHDVVRAFAKSLKPPFRLSLPALETLAVIAYKQPVTVPEISEIRGVDSGGVIATLLDRKLITTAGRKAVIGRPILYKTSKDFLLRFGLKDIQELPSMEEFEKLLAESFQSDLLTGDGGASGTAMEVSGEEVAPDSSGSEPGAEVELSQSDLPQSDISHTDLSYSAPTHSDRSHSDLSHHSDVSHSDISQHDDLSHPQDDGEEQDRSDEAEHAGAQASKERE